LSRAEPARVGTATLRPFRKPAARAAPGAATRLDELGLKASGTAVVLAAEREFTSELDRSKDLRRNLAKAATAVATHEKAFQKGSESLDQLRGQLIQLNGQFASVPAGDVDRHNQLVAKINAVGGQGDLLTAQRSRAEEEGRKPRGTLTEAREAYLQFVLDARKRADAVRSEYATRASDQKVREAVSELSTAESKEYRFGPSPAFQAALRRLTALEETVLWETIDLEQDGKVLGPEAVAAEPLLGMSYLGRFEFKLNPAAGTLTMSRVEGTD
jgi:chromosome segregation ATPase